MFRTHHAGSPRTESRVSGSGKTEETSRDGEGRDLELEVDGVDWKERE